MTDKVYEGIAILGSHPATVELAPFNDDRWLIYACSPHNFEHRTLPRFDAWFETHVPVADKTRAYPYIKYLETLPFVYMRDSEAMKYIPGAVPYPEEQMMEKYGPYFKRSSISLMQAVAFTECEVLHEQGQMPDPKVAYFGIMQRGEEEFAYQKPTIQQMSMIGSKEDWRKAWGLPVIKQYAPDISGLWEPLPENW